MENGIASRVLSSLAHIVFMSSWLSIGVSITNSSDLVNAIMGLSFKKCCKR